MGTNITVILQEVKSVLQMIGAVGGIRQALQLDTRQLQNFH